MGPAIRSTYVYASLIGLTLDGLKAYEIDKLPVTYLVHRPRLYGHMHCNHT